MKPVYKDGAPRWLYESVQDAARRRTTRSLGELVKFIRAWAESSVAPVDLKDAPWVYMIGIRADQDYVKVGRANQVDYRIGSMNGASPFKIFEFFRLQVHDPRVSERELHDQLAFRWVGGEWFSFPHDSARTLAGPVTAVQDRRHLEVMREAIASISVERDAAEGS